jgi:integrase
MASIRMRTSKAGIVRYHVQVRKKGFPPFTATFERKTDAQKWAADKEAELRQQKYFKYELHQKRTVADVIDRYVKSVLPTKPKSEANQRVQLEQWRKELGKEPLGTLTVAQISAVKDKLASEKLPSGKPRSGPTVNRYLAVLSHALNLACKEWGWIEHNPALAVSKFKESKPRDRYLTDDERTRLLEECERSTNRYLKTVVVLAISTGLRRDEIRFLKWSDVLLDQQKAIIRDTKNGETRSVPLYGPALAGLTQLHANRPADRRYVFSSPKKDEPIDFRTAWRVARKNAGLQDFRFHDLRHTTASYLAMNGATPTDIAAVLGHKSIAMAQRYSHLAPSHVDGVVAKMNQKIFEEN